MIKGKRVVITGGAGFIGSSLAKRLATDNEVVILDNLHRDAVSGTGLLKLPNVTLIRGDVLDMPTVEKALRGATWWYTWRPSPAWTRVITGGS